MTIRMIGSYSVALVHAWFLQFESLEPFKFDIIVQLNKKMQFSWSMTTSIPLHRRVFSFTQFGYLSDDSPIASSYDGGGAGSKLVEGPGPGPGAWLVKPP